MRMRRIINTLIILGFVSMSLNAQVLIEPQADEIETVAREFVNLLAKEDFSSATKAFDTTMGKVMPSSKLQQTWAALVKQAGQYKKQLATRKQKFQQYDIVFVTCEFDRATLDVKVVLDSDGKVAGLFFLPAQQSYKYDPPPYAQPDSFIEKKVSVGTGELSLPGTLSLPHGKGAFPAVVLVHGSGPQDRDETIGPNKPFRDLAWGLATRGIAVLRYEKRTKHHAAKLANMKDEITVEEETITDALAAVSLLRNTPEIDKRRVFVLGHSLGGMLIPRIGLRDKQIAGLVIMAGTSRPMEDVIYEQFEYIFNLDNKLTDDEQNQLKQLHAQIQLVKSAKLTEDTTSTLLPLGVPASYWLDLRNYDPAQEAVKLTIPILILQGKRDYQVTMADFKRWQNALSSHKNVRFKLYPSLNHLFIHGKGKSMPSEYEKPGHVHESVIGDITNWILKIH